MHIHVFPPQLRKSGVYKRCRRTGVGQYGERQRRDTKNQWRPHTVSNEVRQTTGRLHATSVYGNDGNCSLC